MHQRLIQFEWPTEKIFELMPNKDTACIESLTLQANELKQLISVQCKLSNGMSSPVYKSLMSDTPDDQMTCSTVNFEEGKPVGSVKSHIDREGQAIMSISFFDTEGNQLGLFFPKRQRVKKRSTDVHALPDDELLDHQK